MKKIISFELDLLLNEKLDELSRLNERSKSYIIRQALRSYLKSANRKEVTL